MNKRTPNHQYFPIQNSSAEHNSTRDILNILFIRKKEVFLCFMTIFLGVIIFTYMSPETYQSEAKVLIRLGRESLALDPTVDGPTVSLSQSRENEVNSELAIIKSRLLAEQVVDKMTPEVFLAEGVSESEAIAKRTFVQAAASTIKETLRKGLNIFKKEEAQPFVSLRENAVNQLTGNLDVQVEQKSNVITVSYNSTNPQFGRQVLNLFLNLYQDHHIQVHQTHATPQFFQDQIDIFYQKLQEKEKDLETFRATHNITSIAIQKETLFSQISRIESDIANVNSRIAAVTAHNNSLQQGLQGRSKKVELGRVAGRKDGSVDTIKGRLFDFRIKEADLSARYPDNHRELMEVREQIRLAESALADIKQNDEVTTGIDPNYQAMQLALENGRAELQGLIASEKALAESLKQPKEELANLVKNETIEARLQRDLSLLEEEYLQYRQDMQRTNVSKALDLGKISNLSMIQPATMPLEPIKPKKSLNIIIGFFISLFGGISLAFFLEYIDDSLKTKEDVERRLGLPVLASVPCEESRLCI